jgi:hypothetical protein
VSSGARLVGRLPLDEPRVRDELAGIIQVGFTPVRDASGRWGIIPGWTKAEPGDGVCATLEREGCFHLASVLAEHFDLAGLSTLWFFCAERGGVIRPHRDWVSGDAAFVRFHIPLITNDHCLNSEDKRVYHMATGEIWQLSSERVHSGGCFSNDLRVHLVLDFAPDAMPLLAASAPSANPRPPPVRRALSAFELDAIEGLSHLVSSRNFDAVYDLLAPLHFEWEAHAGDVYAWLRAIAERSGDPELTARSDRLTRGMIGPGGAAASTGGARE